MSLHPFGLGYVHRALRAAELERERQESYKKLVVEIHPYVSGVSSPIHLTSTRMTTEQVEERIADATKYPHLCKKDDLEFLLKLKELVNKRGRV